ncbi:MAG: phosphatidylglycerophosphatase A [Gammaproteobacteria bacterium]
MIEHVKTLETHHAMRITPRSIWKNPIHFIAFGFGSGAMPFAPGTFGTLVAIPLFLMIQPLSLFHYLLVLFACFVVGCFICDIAEKASGVRDHSGIVFDEIVGYFATMIAAPKGWIWLLIGFVLFRIFDIWKPQPIRWVNQQVHGGFGIMLDDILAAILAWLIIQGLAHLV